MNIDFANNLKLQRENKNMTQADMAKLLCVDEKTVIEWENAHSSPNVETLVKISEIFKIPVGELIFKMPQKGKGSKAVKLSARHGCLAIVLYFAFFFFSSTIIQPLFQHLFGGGVRETYIYPIYWGLILLAVLIVICTGVILETTDEKKGR